MALTNNHRHAIALARQILSDERAADEITDSDWALLMLAADVNRCDSAPQLVARRVLDAFERQSGYFDPCANLARPAPAPLVMA